MPDFKNSGLHVASVKLTCGGVTDHQCTIYIIADYPVSPYRQFIPTYNVISMVKLGLRC